MIQKIVVRSHARFFALAITAPSLSIILSLR
jgi:hypothetical protein